MAWNGNGMHVGSMKVVQYIIVLPDMNIAKRTDEVIKHDNVQATIGVQHVKAGPTVT